ncbi:hypothetical protein Patl1_36275 [Pistacia atlantica]|nr:hypothetical protein Patl1_36275 [Pistacia atlantica]
MGFYLQLQDTMALLALVFAIIFLCVIVKTAKGSKNKGRRPPEPAGAWPFIGHLHLLGSNQLLHRTFGAMADKYGPTLLIHLGIHQVLVISSWEVAKECFTVNDRIFPTRPRYFAIKLMGYDHAMFGFAPYGPYWREIRKLVAVEILSNHRLELLKHVRDTEINCFIEGLYKKSVKNGGLVAVELKESDASGDDPESRRCQKALGDFFYFVGLFLASDAVPCLGWLDYVKGYVGEMKRTARELDSIFESWVQEHHQKRLNRNINEEEHDLIDVMLSIMDEGRISAQDDAHTVIKATCLISPHISKVNLQRSHWRRSWLIN